MLYLKELMRRYALALLRPYYRLSRGMTLGARVLVLDSEGRALLVRHSYLPGWTLPGGGVDAGERLGEAAVRELLEETGISATGAPRLHGVFANFTQFPRDHVAVYVVDAWIMPEDGFRRSLEIVDHGFFSADELPLDTAPGARRRIAEVLRAAPVSPDW